MKKSEKIIIGCGATLTLAMGVATFIIMSNPNRPQTDDLNADVHYTQGDGVILTELKVGKYYLMGGSENEYIEVYPDKTICMFGYDIPENASEDQRKDIERFTKRRYYALSDMLQFIGLSDEPCDRVSAENKNLIGYGYSSENVIDFTKVINGEQVEQKYVYREE